MHPEHKATKIDGCFVSTHKERCNVPAPMELTFLSTAVFNSLPFPFLTLRSPRPLPLVEPTREELLSLGTLEWERWSRPALQHIAYIHTVHAYNRYTDSTYICAYNAKYILNGRNESGKLLKLCHYTMSLWQLVKHSLVAGKIADCSQHCQSVKVFLGLNIYVNTLMTQNICIDKLTHF